MPALTYFPTNPLERVLARAAEDPSSRPEFYRLLLESPLYLLTSGALPNPGARIAEAGESARLVTIDVGGEAVFPIFTSVERIEQLGPGARAYVGLRGKAAFALLAQHPNRAILNPGFSNGKELTVDEIRALASGTFLEAQLHDVPEGGAIRIGEPASPPTALFRALSSFFTHEPTVTAAYVAEVDRPGSGVGPHPLVGVVCSGDFMAVAGRIGALLRELDLGGDPVDVAHATADAFGGYFLHNAKPFYVRART